MDKSLLKKISLQKFLGWLALPFMGSFIHIYLKYIKKYKVSNIEGLRKEFKNLVNQNVPILICPNHLTFLDSAIIQWALAPVHYYFFHYRSFVWNIPAKEVVNESKRFKLITYLSKCLLLERKGEQEHIEEIMQCLYYLIAKNEPVLVYTEGGRSRTGKIEVEEAMYGIGKIIQTVPTSSVLCIYLRGKNQDYHSNYPIDGEDFYLSWKVLNPKTEMKGLRGQRDLAMQVILELKSLEDIYFAQNI